ncbi:hypothetical protein [Simiduia agarivorans]|uniref:Uncharacterized protein n=1 Tax=Simiduia agarivorans (strain DSM 21679 / JCM 13881 / BCRC 17597 / SA1) TaxID=1117647 RepID=K4KNW6_SIMAS|nr:hypothetical protein [Simiduia agarivorans]AFU99935.1 hypothetical protein M5M_13985 [Simiduia agarivorans SA1 = DSM 21679]
MSKNKFRATIVLSLLVAVVAGVYDYVWPDPFADQALNYVAEIEPVLEGGALIVVTILGFIAGIMAIVSFIGLLLFKSWARHIYLAGFVVAFSLYPFFGVMVTSGISQIFYDLSMVLSGVVIALAYYSPVARHYEG